MMKKNLTLLILVSIVAIGVLGFPYLNHGEGYGTDCLATAAELAPCPENISAMTLHHVQAYISFFRAIPSLPMVFLFLFLLGLFLGTKELFSEKRLTKFFKYDSRFPRQSTEEIWSLLKKIIHWLSLFENSPSGHRLQITLLNLLHLCESVNLKKVKTTTALIQFWSSILFAGWSLKQTILRPRLIIRERPTFFALFPARITLAPILRNMSERNY